MTETLSIRIDSALQARQTFEVLSRGRGHSRVYVESEKWQLGEIQAGITELNAEQGVPHEEVSKWLKPWGKIREAKAPR